MAAVVKLAIGCPIFEREWCIDRWVDSIEAQDMGGEVSYHFVYTPGEDDTLGAIRHRLLTADVTIIEDDAPGYRNAQRADASRYAHLARLRNLLLDSVRASGADYFLSWDSDVILADGAVRAMFEVGKPVVGALIEMLGQDLMLDNHPEGAFPSWMRIDPIGRTAERANGQAPIMPGDPPTRVGVVMAVVLWHRSAFERVNYAYHPHGEDIGIALECSDLGIEQWLAPRARGVHLHQAPGDKLTV
jgi:hypothetical protein